MLTGLSPEQEVLRDTTARFLSDHASPTEIRRLRDDPAGYDPKYWRRGAELGWVSLLVAEQRGGGTVGGEPIRELAAIAHEFGAAAAPGPLVSSNVVASALDAAGGPEDILARLMSGECIVGWCLAEAPPGDGVYDVGVRIDTEGSELVVRGLKRPVESAIEADYFLVTGATGDSLTQVLVGADTAGVSVEPMRTVDLTKRFGAVRFDDVRVPVTSVVGEVGRAAMHVERQLRIAAVVTNAESIGAMQRAFDLTVAWAADRYSFGRPLSSYQALKHRFADMFSWLEASYAINGAAVAAVGADAANADELVSAASAFVGEYGVELVQECVQLHGGIGVTFEHDLHLFLRRVTVNRMLYGTPAEHRLRVAGLVLAEERPT